MATTGGASSLVDVTGSAPDRSREWCDQLERGQVLFFQNVPFAFPEEDKKFLLSQKQADSRFHKNISYKPANDVLNGVSAGSPDRERLHRVMRDFSAEITRFVSGFLAPYAGKLKLDYASFRPLEEQARELPLHKRNDLLHVDAFPTRPTHGGRILRVFVNINPDADRVWKVGEPFHVFLPKVMQSQTIHPHHRGPAGRLLASVASKLGLPVPDRSRYDEFMLYLHDWLKENGDFQKNAASREISFPPGCCWMVYTDGVPHAVMSGQYALEQTYIVPAQALVSPQAAPVNVLQSATGKQMVN